MISFSAVQETLARQLWEVDAVKDKTHRTALVRGDERGFRLKLHEQNPNAPLSPVYFNLRTLDNPKQGPLTPTLVDLAGRALYNHCYQGLASVADPRFRFIAGVPNAGDPLADAFAAVYNADQMSDVSVIRMGKQTGLDGSRQVLGIIGDHRFNLDSVFMVDDLITAAESKLEAVKVVNNAGGMVYDVAVLLDREQGGREQLLSLGIMLHSVFTITQLLAFYVEAGLMKSEIRDEIMTYIKANHT